MALAYIDLGVPGDIQLLVLNNGVPYGIQNAQGLSLFAAGSSVTVTAANETPLAAGDELEGNAATTGTPGSGSAIVGFAQLDASGLMTVPVKGIIDGSVAATGVVGELLSTTTSPTPVAFAATGTNNLTTLNLEPGDWDVWGNAVLSSTGGSAVPADAEVGISSTSGALPSLVLQAADAYDVALAVPVSQIPPPQPFNITVTTPVYLVMHVNVTSGTDLNAIGILYARRSR
jgi:hypothetical protein